MTKIGRFLLGFLLLLLTFGIVFLASAIYDTAPKVNAEVYFFQAENEYQKRISEPIAISDLSKDELRDVLLEKYLIEYFYAIPEAQNLEKRKNRQTSLYPMSTAKVFNEWLENVFPEISELSARGALRTVRLISATETPTDTRGKPYWKVEYELKTWEKPNDFVAVPVITRGTLFMQISYSNKMMQTVRGQPVLEYLESGKEPVAAFSFGIIDIATEI